MAATQALVTKLLPKILKRTGPICMLVLVGSIIYTLYAISDIAVEPTRISENALLPGLVAENFQDSRAVSLLLGKLKKHNSNSTNLSTTENVYGIVRAYRAAPVESILVVVELDPKQIKSIAIALTLATYVKDQIYWARDIIFLFVEDAKIGTEAWLAAFYGAEDEHEYFDYIEELEARGGPIIGAFALDLIGNQFGHLNIQYGMVSFTSY